MSEAELKQTAFSFTAKEDMGREDFMVSDCNKEAFLLIDSWPDWIGSGLVIYGPKGCGKTHLAHMFADKVRQSFKKAAKVPFYDCQQINMKNVERICNLGDAIILENLSEKVDMEALFHLFNHFNRSGKWMLWTSEIAPARLNFALQDLQSRLNMLPAVEIKKPDEAMLRALIVKLFDDRQLLISPEILEYILSNTERSFAYVENLVKEIDEISLAYKSAINYKVVKEALKNINNAVNIEPDLFFN